MCGLSGSPHAVPWDPKGTEKSCSQEANAALPYTVFPEFMSHQKAFTPLCKNIY